jgi:hypothetical protein
MVDLRREKDVFMEIKSYITYLEQIVAGFDYELFAPENSANIYKVFENSIYKDTPYWKAVSNDNNCFYVEFKKYGENRKIIYLKFSFISNSKQPRDLQLSFTDDELKDIKGTTVVLSFSEIWKDHSVLLNGLKSVVENGLRMADDLV